MIRLSLNWYVIEYWHLSLSKMRHAFLKASVEDVPTFIFKFIKVFASLTKELCLPVLLGDYLFHFSD